ncbi:ThiF family adenylyltransferase [Virgibacillus pantothenticus]|uniref:ThiF family adenylyltransferase n=1 Tax=Virgibacillus pantothenticus TaxID=1473 RepID=UPI0027952324|nr:ThiF family adenylyltransferase [Virgibacillus pantothenticus]MEB5454122.1 ThiF family adenylyltransferase [Virgibacillus pantothenticus]MEB5466712.1 ThiF family adenylyltransferase [Virgibacillus pantothenticus]
MLQSLIMIGFQSFILVDKDKVEKSNLNRQLFFGIADEGLSRVEVMKNEMNKKYPRIPALRALLHASLHKSRIQVVTSSLE